MTIQEICRSVEDLLRDDKGGTNFSPAARYAVRMLLDYAERAYDRLEQEPATWVRYSTSMMACSRCGRHTARHRFEYCPHCGAPMRERREE